MNVLIQKYVDSGLFPESVGEYVDQAFQNKESVVVAGHPSTGSRPLMANLMGLAKKEYDTVQVRKVEDLEKDAEYYLIFGAPAEDMEEIISKVLEKGKSFVALKDPDTPYSVMKVFRQHVKACPDCDHIIHQVSLRKDGTGADAVPYTDRVDKYFVNDKKKVKTEKFDF